MSGYMNDSPYRGSGQITREQFLFYEMRTTASLLREGLEEKQVIERIMEENLFQYPTEKTVGQMAKTCIARIKALQDKELGDAIATQSFDTAKQICMVDMYLFLHGCRKKQKALQCGKCILIWHQESE